MEIQIQVIYFGGLMMSLDDVLGGIDANPPNGQQPLETQFSDNVADRIVERSNANDSQIIEGDNTIRIVEIL